MPFHTIIGHEDIEIGVIGFFLQMVAQRGLSTLGLCDNKSIRSGIVKVGFWLK
jgi:hypothetical protein